MSSSSESITRARQQLEASDAPGAWATLRSVFTGVGEALRDDTLFRDAFSVLAKLSQTFGATKAADALKKCVAAPESTDALYDAAYLLYEERQFGPASALLFRANRLSPGQPGIVTELSSALEAQLRYGEAALVLEQSATADTEPLCAYLAGFNWLMTGELERVRAHLARLASQTEPRLVFQREMLAGMLARAEALKSAGLDLGERALTAWHAAINGTVLLHESPHGHADAMRGRYAFVSDSAGLQLEGLQRLKAVLSAAKAAPARVVSAPGRESEILAAAASRVLGAPFQKWSPGAERGALVVAWTLEAVPEDALLEALRSHAPASRLFAHASSWTEPFGSAPDVTTLLHQRITHPWTGGALRVDPQTREVKPAPPDTRPDGALVEEILAATPSDPSVTSLEHVLRVTRVLATTTPVGLFAQTGKRLRQRAGGPVASNRFL